jgi:hypothetical protein
MTSNNEHTVEEAVKMLWMIIDMAKGYMVDPMLTPEEKRGWAKTAADTIGVLNKLRTSQGEKQLEEEDLGTLLVNVPAKYRRIVMRRVRIWIRKSS